MAFSECNLERERESERERKREKRHTVSKLFALQPPQVYGRPSTATPWDCQVKTSKLRLAVELAVALRLNRFRETIKSVIIAKTVCFKCAEDSCLRIL